MKYSRYKLLSLLSLAGLLITLLASCSATVITKQQPAVEKPVASDNVSNPPEVNVINRPEAPLLKAGDYDLAIEEATKALNAGQSDALREKLADAYIARAWYYKTKRLNTYTLKDLTSAVETAPGYYRSYYERGRFYNNQWQFSMGLLELNKAVKLNPGFAPVYSERAYSYYKNQEYDQALLEVNKAIKMDQADATFYYNRSLIYSAQQKFDLSATDLETTLKLTADDTLRDKAARDLKAITDKTTR